MPNIRQVGQDDAVHIDDDVLAVHLTLHHAFPLSTVGCCINYVEQPKHDLEK